FLATEKGFADYELELEYRLPRKGNSGIFLRAWTNGAVNGSDFLELQLIDDEAHPKLKPTQRHGSLFDVAAPDPAPQTPVGEWHEVRVRHEGAHVTAYFKGV